MGEWEIEVDEDENRMFFRLAGYFEDDDSEESFEDFLEAIERVDEGFELIMDISEFQPGSTAAAETLEKGKRVLSENGLAASVRIVPESTTAQMQFERTGEGEEAYQVAYAESAEQAAELLDKR
jgi:hypothetical protein